MLKVFPVFYCLMSRKTENAYREVLAHVTRIVSSASWEVVMVDSELGLRNALCTQALRARISGFHICYERV